MDFLFGFRIEKPKEGKWMNRKLKTTLMVVRHGETDWNVCGKYQGHLDSSLSPLGTKQTEALTEGLSGKDIEAIYSSDLGRAVQTTEIIARKLSLDFRTDRRLRERHLGVIQGKTIREFMEKYPEEAESYYSGCPDYALPDGENFRQLYERNITCVQELTDGNLGRKILIVTHGGVLMSFLYRALNLPLTNSLPVSLFNASINIFSILENQWKLEVWGDTNHLKTMRPLDGIEWLRKNENGTEGVDRAT